MRKPTAGPASPRAGKETSPERHIVERQVTFPHPPEKVWRTLTDRAKLSLWLHPTTDDIKPVVGHRFAFVPAGSRAADRIDCEVLSVQVGCQLAYSWQPANGEAASTVTWTLQPIDGGGTSVDLRHDGALPGSAIPQLTAMLGGNAAHTAHRFRRLSAGRFNPRGVLQCR